MSRSTVIGTVLAVVAVAILAAGVSWDRHRVSGTVAAARANPMAAPEPTSGADDRSLSIIGDSYSEAPGSGGKTWWQQVAAHHDLIPKGHPVGSTGYCAGTKGKPWAAQVPAAVSYHSSTIVLAGSRNDITCADDLEASATSVMADVKAGADGAQVVVVGPLWDSSAPTPEVEAVNAATRRAAEQNGLPFVDALAAGWLTDHPEWIQDDHVHPNPAGVDAVARGIDQALVQCGAL